MIYWTFRLDRLAAQGYLRKGRGENRPHIDVYVVPVRFLLRRLIQQDADVYLAWHNTHHITGVGRPEMRFRRQARFGGVDCGQYLNRQTLAQLQQEYPVVPYQWVPPRLERVFERILQVRVRTHEGRGYRSSTRTYCSHMHGHGAGTGRSVCCIGHQG